MDWFTILCLVPVAAGTVMWLVLFWISPKRQPLRDDYDDIILF